MEGSPVVNYSKTSQRKARCKALVIQIEDAQKELQNLQNECESEGHSYPESTANFGPATPTRKEDTNEDGTPKVFIVQCEICQKKKNSKSVHEVD